MLNPTRKPTSGNGSMMTILATAWMLKQGADVLEGCPTDGKEAEDLEGFFEDVIDGASNFQTLKHSQIPTASVVKNVDGIAQLRSGFGALVNLVTAEAVSARKAGNLPVALMMEKLVLESVSPPKKKEATK